jgi:hypothetical protein
VLGAIGREIGIEKIERNAADSGAPDACGEFTIGKLDMH